MSALKPGRNRAGRTAEAGVSRRELLGGLAALPLAGSLEPAAVRVRPQRSQRGPRIAVVGAGAFGGWTALHLQRLGAEVTLLDAWGPGHSRASSGGETRVIRSLYGPDRIYSELVHRSFGLWREYERRWETRLYHRTGALWMFGDDDAYAQASLPIVTALGFEVEQWSPAEAARRYPQIDFEGVGSVYHEVEAGYLMARRACQAVAAAFVAAGGNFRLLEARPGERTGTTLAGLRLSSGEELRADTCVFACGPWLGPLFPEAVGPRVRSTRQEIYYFGTPPGQPDFGEERLPTWVDFTQGVHYGIPGAEQRGFKVADDTRGPDFDPTGGDRSPSAAGIARVREFVGLRFPGLRQAPLVEARVCQYENSPDGHYIVDRHPELSNVWLVGGGSGHGFKLCPALGELVADNVLGRRQPLPFFSLERFGETNQPRTQFEPPG